MIITDLALKHGLKLRRDPGRRYRHHPKLARPEPCLRVERCRTGGDVHYASPGSRGLGQLAMKIKLRALRVHNPAS